MNEIKRRYFRNPAGVEFHVDVGAKYATVYCGFMKSTSTVEEIEEFISKFIETGYYEINQSGERVDARSGN